MISIERATKDVTVDSQTPYIWTKNNPFRVLIELIASGAELGSKCFITFKLNLSSEILVVVIVLIVVSITIGIGLDKTLF
ncbi:hypothetical protein GCM10028822_16530 [Hymenobacter terrigena]